MNPSGTSDSLVVSPDALRAEAYRKIRDSFGVDMAKLKAQFAAPWRRGPEDPDAISIEGRYAAATTPSHRSRQIAWAGIGSASSHLNGWDREKIIIACQQLGRDNPIARGIIKRTGEYIIGDGPTILSRATNKRFRERATALFNDWFFQKGEEDTGDYEIRGLWNGVQALHAINKAFRTEGDVLTTKTKLGSMQFTEGLLLRNPGSTSGAFSKSDDGRRMVDGVELDDYGKPVAYWYGTWDAMTGTSVVNVKAHPVNEFTYFLSNPNDEWIGSVRGEPSIQAHWELHYIADSFVKNTGIAAELGTFLSTFIESPDAAQWQASMENAATGQPSKGRRNIDLGPASVHFLRPGEKIQQLETKFPQTNFAEFVKTLYMLLGAEEGIPIAALLYDAEGLSWSNIKAILAMAARCHQRQQEYLARWVRAQWRWKLEDWMKRGMLPRAGASEWKLVNVQFPDTPVLSFGEEVKGYVEAINANLMTKQQALDRLGNGTAEEVTRIRGEERADEIAKGVLPIAQPGAMPVAALPIGDASTTNNPPTDTPV